MMSPLSSLLLAVAAFASITDVVAADAVVSVGGRSITLPAPPSYERVDGKDPKMDQMRDDLLGGTNRYVARFEPAAGSPDAAHGREVTVQVMKSIERQEIGERTFLEVRDQMRREFKAAIDEVMTKLEPQIQASGKKAGENLGVEMALSASDMAVLGIFDDSSNSLGFTMAMKVKAKVGDKVEEQKVVTAGMTIPVNGRLLYLYAVSDFDDNSDREWAEKSVVAWRDAVLTANPRVEGPSASLFDWQQVGRSAGIGAAIGGLVGLFSWLAKKKKAS